VTKPRLLLHVGSHKTGTTSIQAALAANRSWLESRGIYYPNPKPYLFGKSDAHHDLAHGLAGDNRREAARMRNFRTHLIEAAPRFDRILLSAEPFYRHEIAGRGPSAPRTPAAMIESRRAYIDRMAEFFAPFDTEILVVLRRPDTFAESLYKNAIVSSPYAGGFDAYLKRAYFKLDYPTRLDLFRARFPALTVRSYESGLKAGIVETFFETIGAGRPPSLGDDHLRRSLTNKATLWLDRSKTEASMGKRDLHRRWHFAMLAVAEPFFGRKDATGLWRSRDERDRFIRHTLGSLPADFFPPPPATLPEPTAWTDAEHQAASAAFRDWERANRSHLRRREILRVPAYRLDTPDGGSLRTWLAALRSRFGGPAEEEPPS